MNGSGDAQESAFPVWLVLVIGIGGSVLGLFLGGIVEILGEPKDLIGGAVVLGATVATLFALAEVDSVMKDDPWLRIIRAAATIVTAWVAVGAAIANGLPTAWSVGAGVVFAGYLIRRVLVQT